MKINQKNHSHKSLIQELVGKLVDLLILSVWLKLRQADADSDPIRHELRELLNQLGFLRSLVQILTIGESEPQSLNISIKFQK